MRLIDAENVRSAFNAEYKLTMQMIEDGESHLDNLAEGFAEADKVIWMMPTINTVSVVRCKNCANGMVSDDNKYIICCRLGVGMEFDDFCSYGERKDGDNAT